VTLNLAETSVVKSRLSAKPEVPNALHCNVHGKFCQVSTCFLDYVSGQMDMLIARSGVKMVCWLMANRQLHLT